MGTCLGTIQGREQQAQLSIFKPSTLRLTQVKPAQQVSWAQSSATQQVQRLYEVKQAKLLGSGQFGKVFLAQNKNVSENAFESEKETDEAKFAIKIVNLQKMSESTKQQMKEELEMLQALDHPFIVKAVQSFNDEKYMYTVMEYLEGVELQEYINQKEHFEESEVQEIMFRILQGVCHMHKKGIAHRDLKPENIMIDQNNIPKIIDFGLGRDTQCGSRQLQSMVGSKLYMAPEILLGEPHGIQCDIWSMGIILFRMLSGTFPFSLRNIDDAIINQPLVFLNDKISPLAMNLISGLLDKSYSSRLTASQALNHPWFKTQIPPVFDDRIILVQKLNSFQQQSKLKMAAIQVLTNMINPRKLKLQQDAFLSMDADNTGMINAKEFSEACFMNEKPQNIIQLYKPYISYSDFLAATVFIEKHISDDKLKLIFQFFDIDDTGSISKHNFQFAMRTLGQSINQSEIDEVYKIHSPKIENEISYQEFKKIVMADVVLPPQKFSDMIKVDLRNRRSILGWEQSLLNINTSANGISAVQQNKVIANYDPFASSDSEEIKENSQEDMLSLFKPSPSKSIISSIRKNSSIKKNFNLSAIKEQLSDVKEQEQKPEKMTFNLKLHKMLSDF